MSEQNTYNEDENLSQEAPFLFGLKKEEPFGAPDGYFDKFQSELQDKIHSNKSSWWNWILKPVVWAPAMVILIVSGIFLFSRNDDAETQIAIEKNSVLELNEISYETLDAYVNENLLAQADTDELLELVGTDEIPSLGTSSEISETSKEITPTIEHVEEADMEEYILENIDDMEVF